MGNKRNIPLDPEAIQQIEQDVLTLLEKTLDTEFPGEFFALNVQLEKEFGNWYLRAYIARPFQGKIDGTLPVSIKNCEDISRLLDPMLDELKSLEPLSYNLEVSSPGLFRELTTEREFQFYQGCSVKVSPKETETGPEANKPFQQGVIKGYNPTTHTLILIPLPEALSEQPSVEISLSQVSPPLSVTLSPSVSKV